MNECECDVANKLGLIIFKALKYTEFSSYLQYIIYYALDTFWYTVYMKTM